MPGMTRTDLLADSFVARGLSPQDMLGMIPTGRFAEPQTDAALIEWFRLRCGEAGHWPARLRRWRAVAVHASDGGPTRGLRVRTRKWCLAGSATAARQVPR